MPKARLSVSVGVKRAKEQELKTQGIGAIENFARDIGLIYLESIDLTKFRKYGILLGEIDGDRIECLRQDPNVDFVEEIGKKFAM